jgi:hypothetical protein
LPITTGRRTLVAFVRRLVVDDGGAGVVPVAGEQQTVTALAEVM